MNHSETPYVCSRCAENLMKRGVTCTKCHKLLCPTCDCALTIDSYCYCPDCEGMVRNKYATKHAIHLGKMAKRAE